MGLILSIDTATERASVCLSKDGEQLGYKENSIQKEHASFLHVAISRVLQEAKIAIKDIDAFAVSAGPGSYTGIRVGMAAAKGFCYALQKPLIAVNTLMLMALAAKTYLLREDNKAVEKYVICPMIDARRMEVYTGLYNFNLDQITTPNAVIVEENFVSQALDNAPVVFFGSGSEKFRQISKHKNAMFFNIEYSAKELATFSTKLYADKCFSDVAYTELMYLKDFFSTQKDK